MYKVLIADDESIILDSISGMIEWKDYGLELIGGARNGLEAYEIIKKEAPDIVITDIRMPGMSGLDLIDRVQDEKIDCTFVILSGYSEFEYASRAMENGVKHYLLKPCDEKQIISVLSKIIEELKQKEKSEKSIKEINHSLKTVLPHAKEQFVKDFIFTGIYDRHDCELFMKIFNIADFQVKLKMILFGTDKKWDFLEKYALKNIAEELLENNRIYFSTIIQENVLLLSGYIDTEEINKQVDFIKETYYKYFAIDIYAGVSNDNSFDNIPKMYTEAQEFLKIKLESENTGTTSGQTSRKYSQIIKKVIQCIENNLHNPDLTLTWIAKDILFMNEIYLGRLFYKETDEKFSQYVMRIRMEKAKELLLSQQDYKIYEICQMTGYSDYTQYFAQVFKKYTGLTPSEYKKLNNVI